MEVQLPHRKGQFLEDMCRPFVKYIGPMQCGYSAPADEWFAPSPLPCGLSSKL